MRIHHLAKGCPRAKRILESGALALALILVGNRADGGVITLRFDLDGDNGSYPQGGIIQASDGDLYGTANQGGANGNGTIYRITKTTGLTTVHDFEAGDATDEGKNPLGKLVEGSDGVFYGLAGAGGASQDGTIFEITAAGQFTLLHSFNGTDGMSPRGGLIKATDGDFYGLTYVGGTGSAGTVFKITATGDFTSLYSFSGNADGYGPAGDLVQGNDGNFYGVTVYGGTTDGFGTVFTITPDGALTTLHQFLGGDEGENPGAGLVLGSDGSFYGTTQKAGTSSLGTVFKITPAGVLTTLYSLAGDDGSNPAAALLEVGPGTFYGTTYNGGSYGAGTAFQITSDGAFTKIYDFGNISGDSLDASQPISALILDADGNLDGTGLTGGGQISGAHGLGSIFRLVTQQLLNISTRAIVKTGDEITIGGFIIGGTGTKTLLLRGIGPSLAGFGIADPLADPTLMLKASDGSTVASNDNWQDSQKDDIEATGLAPQDALESALIATLSPGAYTVLLQGNNAGTGVGLVEIYDMDTAGTSQLANISTRGFVDTGDNVLIGGLIIGGTDYPGSLDTVVRAIGPSLPGVSDTLADPMLELHDSNGDLIAANDNWMDGEPDELTAVNLAPTDDHESALEMSLSPGRYTAIVSGKNGGTGVALVEIYNLDTQSLPTAAK